MLGAKSDNAKRVIKAGEALGTGKGCQHTTQDSRPARCRSSGVWWFVTLCSLQLHMVRDVTVLHVSGALQHLTSMQRNQQSYKWLPAKACLHRNHPALSQWQASM